MIILESRMKNDRVSKLLAIYILSGLAVLSLVDFTQLDVLLRESVIVKFLSFTPESILFQQISAPHRSTLAFTNIFEIAFSINTLVLIIVNNKTILSDRPWGTYVQILSIIYALRLASLIMMYGSTVDPQLARHGIFDLAFLESSIMIDAVIIKIVLKYIGQRCF